MEHRSEGEPPQWELPADVPGTILTVRLRLISSELGKWTLMRAAATAPPVVRRGPVVLAVQRPRQAPDQRGRPTVARTSDVGGM